MTSFPAEETSCGDEATEDLGRCLAEYIMAEKLLPSIVLLCGKIGAGKTVFARGLAQGLGITEPVCSPTFPILLEYPGGAAPLYHFDLYRLGGVEEFELIGGEDILAGGGTYGPGVSVLEWGERLEGGLGCVLPYFRVALDIFETDGQRLLYIDEIRP